MKKLIKTILFWAFAFWCVEAAEAAESKITRQPFENGGLAGWQSTMYLELVTDFDDGVATTSPKAYTNIFTQPVSFCDMGFFFLGTESDEIKDGILFEFEDNPIPKKRVKFWNDVRTYEFLSDRPKATLVISVPRTEFWENFYDLDYRMNYYDLAGGEIPTKIWNGIDLKKNTKWYYNDRFYEDTHSFLKDYYKDTNGKVPPVILEILGIMSTMDLYEAKGNGWVTLKKKKISELQDVGLDEPANAAFWHALQEVYTDDELFAQMDEFPREVFIWNYRRDCSSPRNLQLSSLIEEVFCFNETFSKIWVEFPLGEDGLPIKKE